MSKKTLNKQTNNSTKKQQHQHLDKQTKLTNNKQAKQNTTWDLVLKDSKMFSHPETRSKISSPNDYRAASFTHSEYEQGISSYKKFQAYAPLCFRYRLIKNGFADPKSFQGFRETDPCFQYGGNFGVIHEHCC